MRAMKAILLFLLTCAVALLLWVNWTSIENKIAPEIQTQTQQETTDDDDVLTENEEKGENDASEKKNNKSSC